VLLRQLGIKLFPLSLEQMPQDGSAGGVGGDFQIIEGGLRLESRDINLRKIEGSEFSHRLARGIVHAADQHTDVAHGVLLDQYGCPMVAHLELLQAVTCPATYSCLPNIQVHTADRPSTEVRPALVEAVRQFFLDRSFVQVTDCTEADRTIVIAPASFTPWIAVYDEAVGGDESTEELVKVIQALSARLNTSVVGLSLYNHALRMVLYYDGRLIDRFVSEPEYDEPIASEDDQHVPGHAELWQSLLASGAHSDDLQRVWNQANLDREEGIEDLAVVLGMNPDWTICDWVDVEPRDTFEQFPVADEFTTLCFRLVSPPYYRRHSQNSSAFASCGGTPILTFTVGQELFSSAGAMLSTAFRSTGKASRGVRIVLWGSAIELGLIEPRIARLRPPHRTYPPSFEWKDTDAPFVQGTTEREMPTCQATAEDFEIPAGLADVEAGESNQSGLSWHRAYEAFQLTQIYVYIIGKAARAGKGELYMGAMPLETLEQGLAYWRREIEVLK
jgi:hypothetical protein